MISIKSEQEIQLMRQAGKAAAAARNAAGEAVLPGVTTAEIDQVVRRVLAAYDANPSFLGYNGYPAAACISVNEEVIHGIPGNRRLVEGDIVKIDVGAEIGGYHGDTAATFAVGKISPEAARLMEVTKQSFYEGIKQARAGKRISDISHHIGAYAEAHGFSVVQDFTGHGVGAKLHESPQIPNYGPPGRGVRLIPGMTLAIEPMINAGTHQVIILRDGWTVITADRSLSSHYEHTVLITSGEPELLTE
jgi:methionyl aminopeptidase